MIRIENGHFKDEFRRTRLLRGVNLGGSSKVPATPDGATWRKEGFFGHRQVSFVGRPFPLDEADEHFARLHRWGLTFLRFLVTWEAIEHAGPGIYDRDYLDYLEAVVRKAGEHGLELFIDPHQDVWSRFSGGDGAPGWTFEAVGMDLANFDATDAALTHQVRGDPLPRMIWPTNDHKLASASMFTLFFAGNDFAPQARVDGEPVQEYLQRHYFAAIQQVVQRLQGMPHVVGYDTLNEPSSGYIGVADLNAPMGELQMGLCPTPFQSMLLGEGIPQEVTAWELRRTGMRQVGTQWIDPAGARAWFPGHDCLWKRHGVWESGADGTPRLLRPDYFAHVGGQPVDFNRDYLRPFANRYAAAIRAIDPGALIFLENMPYMPLPQMGENDAEGVVSAAHWYDGMVLAMKSFTPWLGYDISARKLVLGPWAVRRSFARQIRLLQQAARQKMRNAPTLIGEFGIPFDLHEKQAYRSGDFSQQVRAMDRSLRAMDDALASWTMWNYTADNTNARGDQWNDEDLSIFSRDQQADPSNPDSGGRALPAVVRPYPTHIAGEPLRLAFDIRRRRCEFSFRHDPSVNAPTELYLPGLQYPHGCRVEVSDGEWQLDLEGQRLVYRHTLARPEHWIIVRP
jgi:hypothetical protein